MRGGAQLKQKGILSVTPDLEGTAWERAPLTTGVSQAGAFSTGLGASRRNLATGWEAWP